MYHNLVERIRGAISDLEQVIARVNTSWVGVQTAPEVSQQAFVDSVALNLHGFYITLNPQKMEILLQLLPNMWPTLRAEVLAFADYLEALGED